MKMYKQQTQSNNFFKKKYDQQPQTSPTSNENLLLNNNSNQSINNQTDQTLIRSLPQSIDLGEKLKQKDNEIQRLRHALQFYKQTNQGIKPFEQFQNYKKPVNNKIKVDQLIMNNQIQQLIQKASKSHKLQTQNKQLKEQIKLLSIQIQNLTISLSKQKSIDIIKKYKQSESQLNRLKSQIWSLQTQINKYVFQNTQLKKILLSLTKSLKDQSQSSVLKIMQQSESILNDSNSGIRTSNMNHQLQAKLYQCQELQQDNQQLLKKNQQLLHNNQLLNKKNEQLLRNNQQLSNKNKQLSDKNKQLSDKSQQLYNKYQQLQYKIKQNQQQIQSPRRQSYGFTINKTKYISQIDVLDIDRYQLKITQKNKEYQQLYFKYQQVQDQNQSLKQLNQDIQRQRKFLAQRLSQIQVLQQGEEIQGQMQNKLALMSTQLMRMGHLSRTKTSQNKQLLFRIKQSIHKYQLLQRELIQKQKILLNYKQQLKLYQKKSQQQQKLDHYQKEIVQSCKTKLIQYQKEIQRFNYLLKEKQEQIKTNQLKIKIFQEKLHRLQTQNRELEKQLSSVSKNAMNQSTSRQFNIQVELQRQKHNSLLLQMQVKSLQQKYSSIRSQLNTTQTQLQSTLSQKQILQQRLYSMQQNVRKNEYINQQKQVQIKRLRHQYQNKLILKNQQIHKLEHQLTIQQKNVLTLKGNNKKVRTEEIQQILANYHNIEQHNIILKLDLGKYQEKFVMLSQQIERLTYLINKITNQNKQATTLNNQYSTKDKQYRQTKRNLQSVTNKCKRQQQQIHLYECKYKQLMGQMNNLNNYQIQYKRLLNQYQVTKSLLQTKSSQLQQFQKRSTIPLSPRSYLNQSNDYQRKLKLIKQEFQIKFNHQINKFKIQNQTLKQKNQYFQKRFNQEQQSTIDLMSQQVIRLNQVLSYRLKDIVQLNNQIDLYKHKLNKCQQMIMTQRDIQNKQLSNYIKSQSCLPQPVYTRNQQNHSKSQQKQIILLTQRLNQSKLTNISLQQKLDILTSDKIKAQHKLSQLEYSKRQRSTIFHQNESFLQSTLRQIKISNQRLQHTVKQIQSYYIERLQQQQTQLKRLEDKYRQQILKLQKQVFLLQTQNKKLIYQIDHMDVQLIQTQQQSRYQSGQNQQIKKIKQQYQNKIVLITQQLERHLLIKDQNHQLINKLKDKLFIIQSQTQKIKFQNQTQNHTIQVLSEEIVRLSNVLTDSFQAIKQKEKSIKQSIYKIQNLQHEVELIKQSVNPQKLNTQVSTIEYEKMRRFYQQSRIQIVIQQQNVKNSQNKIRQLKDQIKIQTEKILQTQQLNYRLSQQKKRLSQDNNSIEYKNIQLQKNTSQFYTKIFGYQNKLQIQKMNLAGPAFLQQKAQQIVHISQQVRDLRLDNKNLQKKLELILNENKKLVDQVQSFRRSKSNSISTNPQQKLDQDQLRNLTVKYQQQISFLTHQNLLFKQQLSQIDKQSSFQNTRFNSNIKSIQVELNQWQQKCNSLIKQNKNSNQLIQRLKSQYQLKINELSMLKRLNNQLISQNNQFVSQNNQLLIQKNALTTQKNQLISQRHQLLSQNKQLVCQKNELMQKTQKLSNEIKSFNGQSIQSVQKSQYYLNTIKMTTIDQVDQKQQRSRGSSYHMSINQLQQKYQIMDSINKKLKRENQCYRKKSIQYQFKMNKLKQQFDILSKLIQDYKQENQMLKKNKNIQKQQHQELIINGNGNKHQMIINSNSNQEQLIINNRQKSNQLVININSNASRQLVVNNSKANRQLVINNSNQTNRQLNDIEIRSGMKCGQKSLSQKQITKTPCSPIQLMQPQPITQQASYKNLKQSLSLNKNIPTQQKQFITVPIQNIHMLINQIQRLNLVNQLNQKDIHDGKVINIRNDTKQGRYQENLAIMVLLFIEIQTLRLRLANAENERQHFRRQALNPINPNHR